MLRKNLAFSLIELLIAIAIVAILSAIAIPTYNDHITKIRLAEIITFMDYHKIHVATALSNQETINQTLINPTVLIEKLTIKTIELNNTYVIQATINTKNLSTIVLASKPLLINLVATLTGDYLSWNCQVQTGYSLNISRHCIATELLSL